MGGRGRALVLSYVASWKDETERARETARHAHLPLQETRLPPFDVGQLADYAGLLDEPLGDTANFAIRHLSAAIPRNSWIVGGHGSGVLSLMNVNHKHLDAAQRSGPEESLVKRFAQRVTRLDRAWRRSLLDPGDVTLVPDPFATLLERELPRHASVRQTLLAVIRRQFCVEEEMSQLWPILDAFGHVPVMPLFEPPVRRHLDRLPESVLRDELFERRLLKGLAARCCPGYVAQPRQLGYGLPLGEPGYPNEVTLREAVSAFGDGPLSRAGLQTLLAACQGLQGGERFQCLRRLWMAAVLHAWLKHNGG
jgi:hypothetical protein